MSEAVEALMLSEALNALEETAMRIKGERDEAVTLLRESLRYRETGDHGSYKTRVREFLKRLA